MERHEVDLSAVRRLLAEISHGRSADSLESEVLDFKEHRGSDADTVRLLVDTAICFANSRGGSIILGVNDKVAGPEAFSGTTLGADHLRQRLYELTEPSLLVDTTELAHENANLLHIRVPEGVEVHATRKGQASRRVNRDCLPMTPNDVSRLSDERRGVDWTTQPSTRRPADASRIALLHARNLLSSLPDDARRQIANWSDTDVMRALGLITGSHLNKAGAVLLCEDPGVDLIVYQYRRTPSGEPTAVERLGFPLITAFTRLTEIVTARLDSTPVNLPDGQQVQIQDFPDTAVREAVVNALIHRDHRVRRPVQIEHSPAVFAVRSPGPLVAGITPHNILTHSSKPRYPTLAKAVRVLGLAEEVGQGVDRMYRAMLFAGKQAPTIVEDNDEVAVSLVGGAPNTRITKFLSTLPVEERSDTDTLLIVTQLLTKRTVEARTVCHVLQKSVDEAEASLRRLTGEHIALLEPTRATYRRANPQYRLVPRALRDLGPALSYHKRPVEEVDEKVVAHLEDYETINNRTLQRLFDIDVHKASSMITSLTRRGIIRKVSGAERGPAVEYEPGERYPSRSRRARRTD